MEFLGYVDVCIGPLGNRILVCNYYQNVIQVFDLEGNIVTSFAPREVHQLSGVCTLGLNILVVDRHHRGIKVFDHQYNEMQPIPTDVPIKDICISKKGDILALTVWDSILTIDKNGNVTELKHPSEKSLLYSNLSAICCNSRNEILIAGCNDNKIDIYDEDGRYLWSFGSKGTEAEQFEHIDRICVDHYDNILVVDTNNGRISIFSPSGLPIQQIAIPCAIGESAAVPHGICIHDRRIIVTEWNYINIFSN